MDKRNALAKERDAAFTEFVKTGDKTKLIIYCKRYGIRMPKNETVQAAGVYKAVQQCTSIPDDVKKLAAEKCKALGMDSYTLGGKA